MVELHLFFSQAWMLCLFRMCCVFWLKVLEGNEWNVQCEEISWDGLFLVLGLFADLFMSGSVQKEGSHRISVS